VEKRFHITILHKKKQTRYAVMNLHTIEEKQTFTTLMKTHSEFNRNNQDPDWKEAVKVELANSF
jgi:hypothetical protein